MTSSFKPTFRELGEGSLWIDHAKLTERDFDRISNVERLTLWNVTVPSGFLRNLPNLWWIDWRGGNANQGIDQISEAKQLRYLSLNQIRNVKDLTFLGDMPSLELLDLYGLSKVENLPSMTNCRKLHRAQVGQMKSLVSIGPLLEAPNLKEIQLHNWVQVSDDDVATMQQHPSMVSFEWFGENIPDKMWVPVCKAIGLPKTRAMHPEDWFGLS